MQVGSKDGGVEGQLRASLQGVKEKLSDSSSSSASSSSLLLLLLVLLQKTVWGRCSLGPYGSTSCRALESEERPHSRFDTSLGCGAFCRLQPAGESWAPKLPKTASKTAHRPSAFGKSGCLELVFCIVRLFWWCYRSTRVAALPHVFLL